MRSLTVAGCGYGADPAKREDFRAEVANTVGFLREQGMEKFAARYAYGPTRVQLENKSPRAFAEFKRQLAEHSAIGSANTQLGVQRERPSLYDLKDQMKALKAPTLILTGDEDWPCLTWGVSGQAHSFAPAAGVSPAKRGEAQRSRERSDLDAPAAGYTVTSERALARSWLPLWSLPRSFILALRISFGVWIRSVSPSFACSLDGRITSHPVELVGARTIIPHARGRRARVGGDHPVKRRVSARQSRGHRPPGSGEAVAFGFAGMGLSR